MIGYRFMIVVLLASVLSHGGAPTALAADEQESLEAIRARISRMEGRLEEIHGREEDAEAERAHLTLELLLAEARVREARMTLSRRRDEIARLQADIGDLSEELRRRESLVRASVQMAALLGRPGPLRLLSDAATRSGSGEALDTVTALVEGQARLREEQTALRIEKRGKLEKMSRGLEAAKREARILQQRREELRVLEKRVEARLDELRRTKVRTRRELDDLTRRAEALEALIGRLAAKERGVRGDDIRRYRGALGWPAEGRVEVTFGKHRTAKYATYTLCNGVRLAVPPGGEVRSVFPGEVAFARYFKGYGNMVVIDHGREMYTVTAGLATLSVRAGERVALGERLGLAGPAQSDGNVYVEFRSGRRAVDPLDWLRLRGELR